jgi:hypothetical protein
MDVDVEIHRVASIGAGRSGQLRGGGGVIEGALEADYERLLGRSPPPCNRPPKAVRLIPTDGRKVRSVVNYKAKAKGESE